MSSSGARTSGGGGGTAPDASTTVKGLVKLAGDLAGTAAVPTVPGLAEIETSLAGYITVASLGEVGSAVPVGIDGRIATSFFPPLVIGETFFPATEAAMLALSAQNGDVAVRTDLSRRFILTSNSPGTLADWIELDPPDAVASVDGQVGVVVLSGDGDPAVAMKRSLGTGTNQALPGTHASVTNQRTPTDGSVTTVKMQDNVVTLAKLADIGTARILGRVTAGSGDPEELTAAQVNGLLGVVLLDLSNGTDDTASINATLAAAPAGSVVRGLPGETYLISAPLKLRPGGRQTLDMTGCTVAFANTGVRTNMLNNAAVTPTATASDVTTTAGSSVITSPALVAAGAAVGMSVGVVAAGPNTGGGGTQPRIWFYGSITAVAGNNITLGGMYKYGTANPNQADVSLANATGHLFTTRDSDVTVVGGTWDAGTNWNVFADRYNAAYNSDLLRFRRCDGLTVRDVKLSIDYGYASSGMGWCFGIAPGDCSNILIERITNPVGKAAPTFVNSSGMIQKCIVRDIVGTAYDDMVAFGCVGAGGDDVEGDIGDLLIDGVLSTFGGPAAWAGMGSNRGVDLYCGKGSNGRQRVLWNAEIRSVKGPYNNWPVSLVSYPAVAGQGANFLADLKDITGYKIGGGPTVFIGRADGTNGGLNNGLDCVGTVTGPNTGAELTQAQITASAPVTGPAVADVAGLSVTFVAPPSGVVLLEAYAYSIAQTVATGNINVFITDSGNNTKVQNFLGSVVAGAFSTSPFLKVRVPGLVSGTSYTFKVRLSGSAGSQQLLANVAYPAFLRATAA